MTDLASLLPRLERLLDRIESSGFDVLGRRISLPAWEKIWLMLRSAAAR